MVLIPLIVPPVVFVQGLCVLTGQLVPAFLVLYRGCQCRRIRRDRSISSLIVVEVGLLNLVIVLVVMLESGTVSVIGVGILVQLVVLLPVLHLIPLCLLV